ncbi:MAG: hypothetical protein WAU91_04970, partial [Desulfatitalea sp.]
IFAAPGGGPETAVGQVVVRAEHVDPGVRPRFEWTPAGGATVALAFADETPRTTRVAGGSLIDAPGRFEVELETTRPAAGTAEPLAAIFISDRFNPDSGDWHRGVALADMDLDPERHYYYALFQPMPDGGLSTQRAWRAAAMATRRVGLDGRLYGLLPAIHQQLDEPTVAQQGQGLLRRFMEIFGAAGDQARSLMDGACSRHDILAAPAAALPLLARWIGWQPDLTLDELAQRRDIRMAPEIFETVGSLPNLRALVNRMTQWECRVKEFVHNIFLTNAPETIHLWEIYRRTYDGAHWLAPAAVTRTDGFHGRPSAARGPVDPIWLFWHGDSAGRRRIWVQRLGGIDLSPWVSPRPALAEAAAATYADEYPSAVFYAGRVHLFWSSDRKGPWEIWTCAYDDLPGGAVERLTEHPADDRNPCAVVDGADRLWLFWQSNRRGPTDIWGQVRAAGGWGLPMRLTTAVVKHTMPAAARDGAGRVWLFWVADSGERSNLYYQILEAGTWGPVQAATSGAQRDEAPCAVLHAGRLWLFFSSDRGGFWRIWGQAFNDPHWGDPVALTAETTADKEPAACVDAAGHLRLYWRSQRRGREYQSRTIDTSDSRMIARMKHFNDRAHYTYDTGEENEDWYSRGTVGLYLTPDTLDAEAIRRKIRRTSDFVAPFRPLPVRLVWHTEAELTEEVIDTDGLIGEDFSDVVS